MDRKLLRNRLKYRTNPDFLKWVKEKHPNMDRHHIIGSRIGKKGRLNDLLICLKSHGQHMREHSQPIDFDEELIPAMELIFDYVEYLQESK